MAKHEKRKTSLGNVLDHDAGSSVARTSGRWRSSSDSSGQQPVRPKLFGSMREAVEYEAAERTAPPVGDSVLDARTLSSLEKTQADEAGYTVIRRRTVGDLSDSHWRTDMRGSATAGSKATGTTRKQGDKEKKQPRGKRSGGAGDSTANTSAANHGTGSRSKPKRASHAQLKQQANADPWVAVAAATSSTNSTPAHATQDEDSSSDQQKQWLAAASMGAVLPTTCAMAPSAAATAATPTTWKAEWTTAEAADPSKPPVCEKPHGGEEANAASSGMPRTPPQQPVAAMHGETEEAASLDPRMISWLESTLSLGETCASPPLHAVK